MRCAAEAEEMAGDWGPPPPSKSSVLEANACLHARCRAPIHASHSAGVSNRRLEVRGQRMQNYKVMMQLGVRVKAVID